jgi:hypothetical protein
MNNNNNNMKHGYNKEKETLYLEMDHDEVRSKEAIRFMKAWEHISKIIQEVKKHLIDQ